MLTVGYARISTLERQTDLDAQQRDLRAAGCERIFVDHVDGSYSPRVMLDQCLALLRTGDVFIVCRPDRLCRTMTRFFKIEADLTRRGVALVVLDIGGQRLDTRLPGGRLQIGMLAGARRWLTAVSLEARMPGIAACKARGGYPGRQAWLNGPMIQELARQGMRPVRIARQMGIARSSVYRYLPSGYKVTPRPPHVPRPRLDPCTIQRMLRTMKQHEVAAALGCHRSSVAKLAKYADGKWR
jgi:DNA invertase Pin-like site-specific DNA recombinase